MIAAPVVLSDPFTHTAGFGGLIRLPGPSLLIGGVAPVAHPQPLRTVVDVALREHPHVWSAGGIPHAVFPTTFDVPERVRRILSVISAEPACRNATASLCHASPSPIAQWPRATTVVNR